MHVSIRPPLSSPHRHYNLTISNDSKFVWFRVAKVGTRSLIRGIAAARIRLEAGHQMDVEFLEQRYADYLKIAFVRNPWGRLVSCWFDKVVNSNYFGLNESFHNELKADFPAFLEYVEQQDLEQGDHHLRLQTCLIIKDQLDYLGRMENFEVDYHKFFRRIGVTEPRVFHINASRQTTNYREVYTSDTIQRVEHLYEADIDILGYQF